jgi:formylglycine-generating enzyme required for sulfatase activity
MRVINVLALCALSALFVACAIESSSNVTPAGSQTSAPFTPIVIKSTDTPLAAPPTPTSAPTATAAPTLAGKTPSGADLITVEMVQIPGGAFTMGSDADGPDAKPAHQVDVPAFMIDKFEVTNADFKKFEDATGYKTDAEKSGDKPWSAFAESKDNHPVVKVSWNDATAFCQWAGKRLPTEAEWEKAARGTDARAYPWGNDWDPKKVNGKDSGLRGTTAVGSYPAGASQFGVMDLAGNVWEWTSSTADHYPGNSTASKLYGSNFYIVRGGGWFDVKDQLVTYYRNSAVPTTANDDLGFRCAK